MDVVRLKPIGRRNCVTLMIIGGALITLDILLLLSSAPMHWLLPMMLVTAFVWVLALGKYIEPRISLELTPKALIYHHRCGDWSLPWGEIQRLARPHHPEDYENQLEYIGLQLRHPEKPLSIPSRLALQLLREQRALSHLAAPECSRCDDFLSAPESPESNRILASYQLHQMRLRKVLGFDLYLPVNSFDRAPDEALSLLKRYQQKALSFSANR